MRSDIRLLLIFRQHAGIRGRGGRHLSNIRHVIIPQHAPVRDGLINAECLDKLMLQFYATADAKNLAADCLAEVRAPPFAPKLRELGA